MTLSGKVALITGAGSGLGAAVAAAFAREGASLVLLGRRAHKLDAVAGRARAEGAQVTVVTGDVADSEAVRELVEAGVDLGGIDILVNNAGIHARPRLFEDIPAEEFDEFLRIDLKGPFLTMKAVLPHLVSRGGGAIINVSSMAGLVGLKYTASYAAAKGGLVAMSRTAAIDYADKGVRVNCICPAAMGPTDPRDRSASEQRLMDEAYAGSPIGRPAHVEEVAQLVLFLAGPSAGPVTGTAIPVDGGYTAR